MQKPYKPSLIQKTYIYSALHDALSHRATSYFGDQQLKRYISVRVVDSGGKPAYYAKVVLYASQALASGPLPEKYTNSDGVAEFEPDLDTSAQVSVSVNGYERVRSGPIQAQYKVVL